MKYGLVLNYDEIAGHGGGGFQLGVIAMQKALRPATLVPPGLAVGSASSADGATSITIHSTSLLSDCPACGAASRRVHSRYRRRIADLPSAGRSVKLTATVRRFRCDAVMCGRSNFTETLADSVHRPRDKRTASPAARVPH